MSKPNGEKNNKAQKNEKENRTQGRPTKFKDQFVIEAEGLAQTGLPQKQMAAFWGISEDSITRWKDEHPAFAEALKKGEAARNIKLLQAMFTNATEKMQPALQIFLAKNWLGMKDVTDLALGSGEFPIKVMIIPHEWKKPKADNGTSGPKKE
jgi:hypothetical protein